jgi:hypothetical protein
MGFAAMYYRSLMVARAEKKRIADEYYFRDFRFNFACHFAYPLLGGHISEIDKLKERMHEDGYSNAEIGIIAEKARSAANDDYLAHLRLKRESLLN